MGGNSRMTEVRIATPSDREAMIPLLHLMHDENGVAPLNIAKMLATLDRGLTRDMSVVGIIEEDGTIKASIGIFFSEWWYSDAIHIEDRWNFVHPAHRKSNYASKLLKFSKSVTDGMGVHLLIGILSDNRTQAKIRLYEREFGPSVGAAFVYPAVKREAA
jgi:GNAT superfamily N-acetyltransferase